MVGVFKEIARGLVGMFGYKLIKPKQDYKYNVKYVKWSNIGNWYKDRGNWYRN